MISLSHDRVISFASPLTVTQRTRIHWEIMLFKPLGRLAGAVLAGALITAAVAAPSAVATESPSVTTTTTTATTTSSQADDSTAPESSEASSSESLPESSSSQTSSSESRPSESESSENSTSQSTPESESDVVTTTGTGDDEQPAPGPIDDYVDDTAYGIDLPEGAGLVMIACAAGQPTGFTSPSFEIIGEPYQRETDGRYWIYTVQRYEGVSFNEGDVAADWTCGTTGGGSGAGSPVQGIDTENTADEDSQVAYAPTGGIETGFGGLGRS
jgi:hypothetical protein